MKHSPKAEELLEKVKEGNKNAIETMILEHMKLAISAVNPFIKKYSCYYLKDELESATMEGLVVAVNNIANGKMPDTEYNTQYTHAVAYIIKIVRRHLYDYYRKSTVVYFPRGEKTKITLPIIEGIIETGGDDEELKEELDFICENWEEKEILELKAQRYTDSEIGAMLDMPELNVQRIRSKLKTCFEKREKKHEYLDRKLQ